jgi:hypothetical protein
MIEKAVNRLHHILGVSAEKAAGLYVPNFFRRKSAKRFSLQSLTHIT